MMDICLCGIAREDCDYHKPTPVVSQVPVYDVTGTCFIEGVTNFTAENLHNTLVNIGYGDYDPSIVKLRTTYYHRNQLYYSNMLESKPLGNDICYFYQGIEVLGYSPIIDSPDLRIMNITVLVNGIDKIILRTREC